MRVIAQQAKGRVGHGYRAAWPLSIWWAWCFEPRDAWVGVYVDRPEVAWRWAADVYVCVLPFLPVRIGVRWRGWAACWSDLRRTWYERRY